MEVICTCRYRRGFKQTTSYFLRIQGIFFFFGGGGGEREEIMSFLVQIKNAFVSKKSVLFSCTPLDHVVAFFYLMMFFFSFQGILFLEIAWPVVFFTIAVLLRQAALPVQKNECEWKWNHTFFYKNLKNSQNCRWKKNVILNHFDPFIIV